MTGTRRRPARPPISTAPGIRSTLRAHHFARVDASAFRLADDLRVARRQFADGWDHLEPDDYLLDGASFRRRRFGRYTLDPATADLVPLPPAAYFQPSRLNAYAGGVDRRFAPIEPRVMANKYLVQLVWLFFRQLPIEPERLKHPWLVDVHQFRVIATDDELGEPAPEGPHHDGEEFGVVQLIGRTNASGGVSSVYTNDGSPISSFSLREPFDALLWWDPLVMHGVSPIRPVEPGRPAIRDVLVLGYDPRPDVRSGDGE